MKNSIAGLEIKVLTTLPDRNEVYALYLEGGWWKEEERAYINLIDEVIKNSFAFAGAFVDGKLIGMGRVLSDGFSDAYIQDVIVSQKYRGQGVGKLIMQAILEHLKQKGVAWIGLIAQPGSVEFYKSLGFTIMEDHTPMVMKIR
ncbi:MAG: GNAT family N-acetyltransferase [Oligoflexia bacterium]|nr:GNAT family N-acetyltransferase [Oligoflexia bacterium]MBF0366925.1 GNAT family N-acetyltransferase [Oligoflexia bacterium]